MRTHTVIQDDFRRLAEQETLAVALQREGWALQRHVSVNPVAATQAAIAALVAVQTWLDAGTALTAIGSVDRAQLQDWQVELTDVEAFVSALCSTVSRELMRLSCGLEQVDNSASTR
ncbi:MAG: hypothetical protein NVS2B16_17240 [Chloroflexota bacterium]